MQLGGSVIPAAPTRLPELGADLVAALAGLRRKWGAGAGQLEAVVWGPVNSLKAPGEAPRRVSCRQGDPQLPMGGRPGSCT
jgi:hypothetical protein